MKDSIGTAPGEQSAANFMSRFRTDRLDMFKLWEKDGEFPLVVTSDRTLIVDVQPGDRVVRRYWLAEGTVISEAVSGA